MLYRCGSVHDSVVPGVIDSSSTSHDTRDRWMGILYHTNLTSNIVTKATRQKIYISRFYTNSFFYINIIS